MRAIRISAVFAATLATLSVVACANLQTIARQTPLPPQGDIPITHGGIAIHLDAQQRLVLASAKGYCAEPSPDALSAYAASLRLRARQSDEDAELLTHALRSSVGSIGLRTQSITLMRDALYRMCEASNNGHLQKWEVASFLRRSQDLTAVVLAIEQLTGAVAASQIVLSQPNGSNEVQADTAVAADDLEAEG